MKENWTYKKLGEVCEVLDSKRKPVTKSDRISGIYPYYGATGIQDYVDKFIFDGDYLLVGEDGAKWGTNDKTAYQIHGKCWVNNHAHILKINDDIANISFLEYYLVWKDLGAFITGAIVQKLTQAALVSIPVPVPPIETQHHIVSELDLLQSLIDKQQAQLKELDTLAQAVFYDMFGDPVENEKGWEVMALCKVGKIARGVSKHRPRNAPELLGNHMPFIQTGDIANSGMYILNCQAGYSELGVAQSKIWHKGTLCITIAANIGKCAIMTFDACFPDSVVGFIAAPGQSLTEYVYFYFLWIQKALEDNAMGAAQKNINLEILNNMSIPVPPLSLQQSFAAKIESIEKQKAAIGQSIAETQKLFDFTMDKYFG